MCAPPRACRQYQVGRKCCEFICLDGDGSGGGGSAGPRPGYPGGSKDLGLRLVASAVTAVLSLALLLFLVYRLRQRRHRGSPSLRPDEAYNMTLMTYLRGSGYLGGGGGGGRGSHDFYYEEPPPPYSLWKPPPPAAGEAPPPYSEAVRLPALRPGPERRPHAVLVLAPAVTAGCVEIARQRATVHRSELDLETSLESGPDLHSYPELDTDLDTYLDPDAGHISDEDVELGISQDPDPQPQPDARPDPPQRRTRRDPPEYPDLDRDLDSYLDTDPVPDRDVEVGTSRGADPEPAVRRSRRDPAPEHPQLVMQRFSLQLQLDYSDSTSSSSPTLTPDAVPRPGSVTSSSSTDPSS